MRSLLVAFALVATPLILPPALSAQDAELTPPPTWKVRLDAPDRGSLDDIWYVDMPPGWHVTTGPAAILWDPERTASGDFRIQSESFLFDPEGRREAFGFFFGGSDLEGPNQSYGYFLIREGGEFIVKTRRGAETETLIPWTAHPSIVSFATKPEDAQTAKNVLALEVSGSEIHFFVNDQEVGTLSRESLPTDGVVGLRVNHNVNIHVTNLDVSGRLP